MQNGGEKWVGEMITRAQWVRFMDEGVEPEAPDYIIDAWRLYRRRGVGLNLDQFPRLSADDFLSRVSEIKWFIDRVDETLTRARLSFEGFVHFFDLDCTQLYSRTLNQGHMEATAQQLTGCRLPVELAGNGVHNLAVKLGRPITLANYEHIASFMHPYAGYAEPVVISGKSVGSFGVYVRETVGAAEAQLLARSVTRLLIESCLAGAPMAKPRDKSNQGHDARYSFADIVHRSAPMREVIDRARLVSQSDYPVLITGESGTGKEYLSHAIHRDSLRRGGPFVAVNCASLSHSLAESELFGYADGAFTGAVRGGRKGKIELADGGTLFLDEVGDLPLSAQAMLLRTLQDHEISRIGDTKTISIDMRVICATNKDLRQLCSEKLFRWDLYYRLAGITLTLPPLRGRVEDLALIAEHALAEINARTGRQKRLDLAAIMLLTDYSWPGNIRELRNIVETSHLLSSGDEITRATIADLLQIQDYVQETLHATEPKDKKGEFASVLEETGGNVSKAVQCVGISRATGYRWLREIQGDKERGR